MKYFDTHSHITKEFYNDETKTLIFEEALKNNITHILVPGTTKEDSMEILNMEHKGMLRAVGIHPSEVLTVDDADFLEIIDVSKIVAIGECGLDLHYDNGPDIEKQLIVFRKQLDFALKMNLPVCIHMRDAEEVAYNLFRDSEYLSMNLLLHSYTGSLEWAKKFINLGFYFSFSGVVTFKNAKELKEVAKIVPLNKIVSETDAPFLSPEPVRGSKNKPLNVIHTIKYIASIRSEGENIVMNSIYKNSFDFFRLEPPII